MKIILPLLFIIVSMLEIRCTEKTAKRLLLLWAALAVPAALFLNQLLLNESAADILPGCIVLGLAVIAILYTIIYLFTADLRLSVIIGMFLLTLFYAADYFVFLFRGSELMPADILSFGTAVDVSGFYHFTVNAPFVYSVFLSVLYCFAGFCIRGYTGGHSFKKTGAAIAVLCILLLPAYIGIQGVSAFHFLQTGSVTNGFAVNFLAQIKESIVVRPEQYDQNHIARLEEKYGSREAQPEGQKQPAGRAEHPDIIVIMDESFADLSVFGSAIQTNQEVTPFLDSLTENTIRGYTLSSVYGGGTPNSEYEFLTGNTMAFLPRGSIVYQQFLKNDISSVITSLEQLGYDTIATHPYTAHNWMRDRIYPLYSFNKMFFLEEYPQQNLVRTYVSDREMAEEMIAWYEQYAGSRNLFMFGVTMQNHGAFTYRGNDFSEDVSLEGYRTDYPETGQYLTLIHKTDAAMEYLISYFSSVDRDVVVLFYGDHHPKLESGFYEEVHNGSFDTLDDQMLQYIVPFLIWTNYDMEEKTVDLTSMNFLSLYLMDAAGLEKTPYMNFLSDVQSVIPAMNSFAYYSVSKGGFVSYDEAEGREAEILSAYEELEYNSLFDEENTSTVFFSCN